MEQKRGKDPIVLNKNRNNRLLQARSLARKQKKKERKKKEREKKEG